jgi:flagellar hook-length control protein FliK
LSSFEFLIASLKKSIGKAGPSEANRLLKASPSKGSEPGKEFASFLAGINGNKDSASILPGGLTSSAYAVLSQEKVPQKFDGLQWPQDKARQAEGPLKSNSSCERTAGLKKEIWTGSAEVGANNRFPSFQVEAGALQKNSPAKHIADEDVAGSILKTRKRQGAENKNGSSLLEGSALNRGTGQSASGNRTRVSPLEKVLDTVPSSNAKHSSVSEKAPAGSIHSASTPNHGAGSPLRAYTPENRRVSDPLVIKQPDSFFIFEKSTGATPRHSLKAADLHDQGKTPQIQTTSIHCSSSEKAAKGRDSSTLNTRVSPSRETVKKASFHLPGDHQTIHAGDDKSGDMVVQIKGKDIKDHGAASNRVNREHHEIKPQPEMRAENSAPPAEEHDSRIRPSDSAKSAGVESNKTDALKARTSVSETSGHHLMNEGIIKQTPEPASQQSQQRSLSTAETHFRQELLNHMEAQFSNLRTNGFQRATIILDPPYLGSLEVEIKVHGAQIKATFVASTEMVKNLLESNMADLKQSFADAGFEQGETSVFLRENKSNGSGGRGGDRTWPDGFGFMPYEQKGEHSVASIMSVKQDNYYLINLRI